LESSPKCSRYISPDKIQKEILGIYAIKVREHIRHGIWGSKFYILVDHMDVVFRFVDKDGVLQERFFQLIHVRNTKSLTLKGELCGLKSKHAFDVQNLYDQGYDRQAA
jgi:hypothetical protein